MVYIREKHISPRRVYEKFFNGTLNCFSGDANIYFLNNFVIAKI
jgi:hypothetical protein